MAHLIKSLSKCPTGTQNVKTINPYVPHLIKPSTFAFNTKSMIRRGARFRSDSFVFSRPMFTLLEAVGACHAPFHLPINSHEG